MIENCWAVNETLRSDELELTIPQKSLLRIQVWDWDLATCLVFSAGYNVWRDTKKPDVILNELSRTAKLNVPAYTSDYRSLAIGDVRFDCNPECLDFAHSGEAMELAYRKVPHESP